MKRASLKGAALALLILNLVGVSSLRAAAAPSEEAKSLMTVVNFDEALGRALARRGDLGRRPCDAGDAVSLRLLTEYGAVFVAGEGVLPPPVCAFSNSEEVATFQTRARALAADFGGVSVELQPAAMRALLAARAEALAAGLDITPRDGTEAARRDYADTVRLWDSRLLPALEYWKRQGRLTEEEAGRVKALPAREQVGAVLELERRGVFFSKDFSKSILHSVAAPGASQHLSMLAFDVSEYADARVRAVLARHGWFRTVQGDLPHFTYLGLREERLPSRGLKKMTTAYGEFWVPNVFDNYQQSPSLASAAALK
jgi:hypothetical protein